MGHLHLVPSDEDGDDADVRFEHLYDENFRAVYAYFLRRVAAADAPDLVSEVFTTAWRRIDKVPPPPEDRLWLYGVAHRVASQHDRGRLRRERLFARIRHDLRPPDQPATDRSSCLRSEVLDLLSRLKPDERELVRLVVWEELSHAEVAALLGCSTNAVTIRWHRSIERLRRESRVSSNPSAVLSECDLRPARTEGT
ncbi:MAG: sigma-70 family RNA polymerase sigma factor [Acidimicrobiales bacterium]